MNKTNQLLVSVLCGTILSCSLAFTSVQATTVKKDGIVSNQTMGINNKDGVISKSILPKLNLKNISNEILKNALKDNNTELKKLNMKSINSLQSETNYTPFINYSDQVFNNKYTTPLNENVTAAFEKIKIANPSINYSPSLKAIGSQYLLSTTINGVTQDFYVMEIVYTTSFYVEDHGLIIYNQNYKSHPLYNNGHYEKGFDGFSYGNPKGKYSYLSFKAGIISSYVPIYTSKTTFGEYRDFYLFDFFNPSINLKESGGYDKNATHPYFVSWVSTGNRIIYGRSYWFGDGSGNNNLARIDRITGAQISNNNLPFITNNEFESGILSTYDAYSYTSTVPLNSGTYKIDLNTLQLTN
ncbi:hypothetical protein [Clostridium estertheticum]|uniref:hypothetical protein n=1 Tax=Clostridium estertheticum TaxID=238834 RepID=UPI001CF43E04|nr:hypothetical protein [Clostridium estertheticum]MCB2356706.1 hypothetical protein [Clostridium estertheticum]WAG42767.1 hypothetical protein LL065_08885 [Clostridium estertheticum]